MKRLPMTAVVALILFLGGCFLLGPEDIPPEAAAILSFEFDGLSITATIDPAARTVVVSSPPIDLSVVTPTIGVTDGALVVAPAQLVDGAPATYQVVSESGVTEDWTVTVNLELGMTFKLDGQWIVLLNGTNDAAGPFFGSHADDWGNGAPIIHPGYQDSTTVLAFRDPYEYDSDGTRPPAIGSIQDTMSEYDGPGTWTNFEMQYAVDENLDLTNELWFDSSTGTGTVVVSQDSLSTGDIAIGTFSFTGTEIIADVPSAVTDGFFKVLRADGRAPDQPWTPEPLA